MVAKSRRSASPPQHRKQPPHPFLREPFHQDVGERGGELAVAPGNGLRAVHEVNRDIAIARQRQHVIVEIGRACRSDGDLLRARRSGREQRAHPAKCLNHLVLGMGAGVEDRLRFAGRFGLYFYARAAYPIRNMPRSRHPCNRNDFAQGMKQRSPARRHLAVALDLDGSEHRFREADARTGQLDQVLRPFHARRQPA